MDRYPKPDSALDKEIHIRLSPRSLLKTFIFFLLLTSVFYLGRWSVSSPESNISESDVSGFSIGDWFRSNSEKEEETPTTKSSASSNSTNTTVAQPARNEVPAATESTATENESESEETDANVITKYSKVALAVADVTAQWKGTYGKITSIQYTIANNEEGTIKPDHFVMVVEGYDDFEKKVPLPVSSKTINAGETKSANLLVPQGFAYSPLTAGDLTNVKITFKLIDGNDKEMSMYEKQYVLKSS